MLMISPKVELAFCGLDILIASIQIQTAVL